MTSRDILPGTTFMFDNDDDDDGDDDDDDDDEMMMMKSHRWVDDKTDPRHGDE